LGWKQISTGNLCRQHIQEKSPLGLQIDFAIKSGKLIEDDVITEMVADWLYNNLDTVSSWIILDGFPRTVNQAQSLDLLLKNKRFKEWNLNVVHMQVSDDAVVRRLQSRIICANGDCQAVYSLLDKRLAPKDGDSCMHCLQPLMRRSDDKEVAVILDRLQQYHQHEQALLRYFERTGKRTIELFVEKPLEEVFKALMHIIGINKTS
jgi:adenylate kinase